MADTPKTTEQENVDAFRQGVAATAPKGGWSYSANQKPADTSDVKYAGVEVATSEGGMKVDGQQMRVPKGDMSAQEIFAEMSGVSPSTVKNGQVPGSSQDYYAEIGQHEGGHLHDHNGSMDGGVSDEIAGDRAAYNGDRPEVEEAIRDSRKIATLVNPSHATSLGLPDKQGGENPEVNTLRINRAAKAFHDTVAADLISKGKIDSAQELEAYHKEHPEVVRESVESLKKGGAFEAIDGTVGKYARQMADDYIDASKRRLNGPEDSPKALFQDNAQSVTTQSPANSEPASPSGPKQVAPQPAAAP